MRRMKSTNMLLSVNAVLMGALMWSHVVGGGAGGGAGSSQVLLDVPGGSAYAQSPLYSPHGVPNAGKQRQQTIDELRALRASVESMKVMLQGGPMKVQIVNVEDLKTAAAPGGGGTK